jgi:TolB protein
VFRRALTWAVALFVAALLVGSSLASGASRGRNGLIAFTSVRASGSFELYTMRPEGSHLMRRTRNAPVVGYAAWSSDGRRVAFINVGIGELWLMRADGRQRRPLVQRVEVCCASPTWSPTGTHLAFARAGAVGSVGLWTVDTRTGRLQRITNGKDESPAWRPDGQRIAFIRGGDIYTVASRGGRPRRLMRTRGAEESDPSWARDGRLAFAAYREVGEVGLRDLFVINANGSGLRKVPTPPETREYQPDWSPDGKELLFCDYDRNGWLFILTVDGRNLREFQTGAEYCGEPDWSPGGSRILFHRDDKILSLSLPKGEVTPLVDGRSDSSPAWSPDGQRLAFVRDFSIYILRVRDAKVARVADGHSPSWSPDGQRLAVGVSGEPGGIFIVRADGAGRPRRILSDGADVDTAYGDPAWSPDGSRLAFHSVYWRTTPSDHSVCILRVRSPQRRRCVAAGAAPSWSPDGRLLVHECGSYDPHGICTVQPDGKRKRKRRLSTRGRRPRFSPDGRHIVYYVSAGKTSSRGPGATSDVYVMSADGTQRRRLTRSRGHDFDPDWQPRR